MVNTPALHQALELFRANWPHRFPDHDTYSRLLALYALGCEDLTDAEWLAASVAAVRSSRHMPTPAELNDWARPPSPPIRDPELDYRPVNTPVVLRALPPASPESRASRQAEWTRMKDELKAKWRAMDDAQQLNPTPGPGMSVLDRRARRRRPRTADYAERNLADLHLESVTARLEEGRERWQW